MIKTNIPLSLHSNYKIGGIASYFTEFLTVDELVENILDFRKMDNNLGVFVLGSGTNILFSDEGFDGLVLKNSISFINANQSNIEIGAGTLISDVVSFCIENSLSGMEWAGGLPGTVGGAVRGNAGAFSGEMKDSVVSVESLDLSTLQIKKRNGNDCKFNYRQSIFKNGEGEGEIILSVKLSLVRGRKNEIKTKTQEKIDYRIEKHPLDLPNIGSIFKNVPVGNLPKEVLSEFEANIKQDPFPVLPVAKLILGVSLRGFRIGGAEFSEKHPNFIVNFNNAKAQDVLSLISLAKAKVKEKYDITLEEEIMIV